MLGKVNIWIVRVVLVFNAMVFLASITGSSILTHNQNVIEEASANGDEEQSTGSANFHFVNYAAVLPEFHYYIPLLPSIVFEIILTLPERSEFVPGSIIKGNYFDELLFRTTICPNAP